MKPVRHHVVKKTKLGLDATRFDWTVRFHLCECFVRICSVYLFLNGTLLFLCTVPGLHRHRLYGVGFSHINNSQSLPIRNFGNSS